MAASRSPRGLEQAEYVEQSFFFRLVVERLDSGLPLQDLLAQARDEVLTTVRLPLAVDFLLSELKHCGTVSTAMARLSHYFTSFQTFVVAQAENDVGRFDMRTALDVLRFEADFRSKEPTAQGSFLFQLEVLCRNRLPYERGLAAVAEDPIYDDDWRDWVLIVRRQFGIVDLADLIYVRSQYYRQMRARSGHELEDKAVLFGEKEGKIAYANRRKDPLYLFAALQRHLNYPAVPRRKVIDTTLDLVPQMQRRLERLEQRLKLLEEEQRGGIDLSRFGPDFRPPG